MKCIIGLTVSDVIGFAAVNKEATLAKFKAEVYLNFVFCLGAARGGKHLAAVLFT
jgi:hypothetical protein